MSEVSIHVRMVSLELPVSSVVGASRVRWSTGETTQGLETTTVSSDNNCSHKASYRLDTGQVLKFDFGVCFTRPVTSYQRMPSCRGAFRPLNQHVCVL